MVPPFLVAEAYLNGAPFGNRQFSWALGLW